MSTAQGQSKSRLPSPEGAMHKCMPAGLHLDSQSQKKQNQCSTSSPWLRMSDVSKWTGRHDRGQPAIAPLSLFSERPDHLRTIGGAFVLWCLCVCKRTIHGSRAHSERRLAILGGALKKQNNFQVTFSEQNNTSFAEINGERVSSSSWLKWLLLLHVPCPLWK